MANYRAWLYEASHYYYCYYNLFFQQLIEKTHTQLFIPREEFFFRSFRMHFFDKFVTRSNRRVSISLKWTKNISKENICYRKCNKKFHFLVNRNFGFFFVRPSLIDDKCHPSGKLWELPTYFAYTRSCYEKTPRRMWKMVAGIEKKRRKKCGRCIDLSCVASRFCGGLPRLERVRPLQTEKKGRERSN